MDKKPRKVYHCRKCGQPKRGHVCAFAGEPSIAQHDNEEATMNPSGKTVEEFPLENDCNFFVVLDLEATCDQDFNRNFWPQEIIEFSAVLLDVELQEAVDSVQIFVKPQEHPTLTPFCIELTGIQQHQVDNGVTFAQCMKQFDGWLKESRWLQESERGRRRDSASSFLFATWSDWDLGVMLDEQCLRTEVEKPSYFNQWIDLKHLYQSITATTERSGASCSRQ